MGKTSTLVMNTVKRFVQQTEREKTSKQASGDNAAGRAIHRVSGHPDVLDVFSPALKIRRQKRRGEIQPKKIPP
jgi:hypothetical protein